MFGFFAGILASTVHVITGPDHLAAVGPLAIDSRKKSWMIGLGWGIGHTAGMLAIGVLFLLLKNLIPVEKISSHSEILVGVLLIGIGTWAVLKVLHKKGIRRHIHPHIHFRPHLSFHIHWHSHELETSHSHTHSQVKSKNAIAAMLVGIVHGISGFSHLLAVLPVLALPGKVDAFLYLTGFAAGTIFTMVTFSLILGMIAYKSSLQAKMRFLYGFSLSAGILAIGTGIIWVIRSI